ncbi:MAG: class I adenylate cyclase [Deltaproteobacteria bacterium]|nr:class I adenylate cyclase [Deltaproteobacteria bacterium]
MTSDPDPTTSDRTTAGPSRSPEEAFAAYNRHRRLRLEAQAGEKGREALRLLPFLLHLNQPGLPGYVDDAACPVGIPDYSPGHGDLALARRLFPKAAPRRVGILRPFVELVAVMGSVGTIGFSGESDLDIWVCHGRRSASGVALFREKVSAIEAWMNAWSGQEVHLFLQEAGRIRANDFGEADLEGCGSAMGALLKEEFYRTGILLAGRIPLWWLVSAGSGPEGYDRRRALAGAGSELASGACVDLGPVARVPLGELFGAAIWQIVKSWKSPFKSALKMGLLEKAVRTGDAADPLCEILKSRVHDGARPDPYRLLFDEVLAYYRDHGDAETEDLLARCFYLKTGLRLDSESVGTPVSGGSDEAVLSEYVRSWGWGPRRVRHLNQFAEWKFEWVQALAKEIDRYFLRTYQRIRAALDASGESQRITDRDLTILGRKLQTAYRRAPHKVETLHLVGRGVAEATLTLFQEVLPTGEAPWSLFRGVVSVFNVEERRGDLLRSSPDPLELLVWAAQNGIFGLQTRVASKGAEQDIPSADLEGAAQLLAAHVTQNQREPPHLDALLEKPRPTRLLIVPNLGQDDEEIASLGAVWTTTWGETFYRRWEGVETFRSFTEDLLLPYLRESPDPSRVQVWVPARRMGSPRGPHSRLQREIPALVSYLGSGDFPEDLRRRQVGPAVGAYFVLDRSGGASAVYKGLRGREPLLRYLSGVGPYRRVETRVESHPGDLAILKTVTEVATEGLVDVFVLRETERETLFVVDEIGNLSYFVHPLEGPPYALAKLLLFLERTLPDVAHQTGTPLAAPTLDDAVRIHTLIFDGTCRALTSTFEQIHRARSLGLNPKGLTIERLSGRTSGYVVTWGGQTLRSGDVDNPLEELRQRIREERVSGLDYGIFVTRLFLDERFVAEHCGPFVTTGHYLFYKKAIEQRLGG